MRASHLAFALAMSAALFTPALPGASAASGVAVTVNDAGHKVDVTVDGKPFTSYLWQSNLRKPVLYPLIAPDGTTVNRGYPFVTIKGERVDHPHHVGLWFNYSNVNGFDFWNNSDAVKPIDRAKFGSIEHDRIVSTKSGKNSGELVIQATWITGDPAAGNTQQILTQTTKYVFSKLTVGDQSARAIDLIVTLKALVPVTFHDQKDGMLGIRVAQFLESPAEKGGTTYANPGSAPKIASADTLAAADTIAPGASPNSTGVYRTSEGIVGDRVWGTRGRWCELSGTTPDGKIATIAVLDHIANPGYPTYWHARGYGLFAANPLGAHNFDAKVPAMNFTLDKGASTTFRYRILFLSGDLSAADLNQAADSWDKAAQ